MSTEAQPNPALALTINPITPPTPAMGFCRLSLIIGDPKADPPIPAMIPVSRSAWWKGIQEGRYPRGVKLGKNTTAWRVEDIYALIEQLGKQAEG